MKGLMDSSILYQQTLVCLLAINLGASQRMLTIGIKSIE